MTEKFKQLLESAEGLTEEFKSAATPIFEEAVKALVDQEKQKLEEQFSKEYSEKEVALKEEFEKTIEEKTKEIHESVKQSYVDELKKAADKIAEFELTISENEQLYNDQLKMIGEQVEVLASKKIEESEEALAEKVNEYLGYCVEQFFEEHKEEILNSRKVQIAEHFMAGIKSMFEDFNMTEPTAEKMYEDKISDLESKLEEQTKNTDEAYTKLAEELQRGMDFKLQIEQLEKEKIVRDITESMTDTQKERFAIVLESIDVPFAEFESKVRSLAEEFATEETQIKVKPVVETVNIVSDSKPIVEEQKEEKTVVVEEHIDPMVAYFAAALNK